MASESNIKLTAQGLAGIQSSFFKNSGKQIKQISRYPVLEFTHAASWCLILTHSLGLISLSSLIRLIRLLLSNNTLFQRWASQQYPHEVCQSKSPPSPPNRQGHHGNPSSTCKHHWNLSTSRFLKDFNAISAISSSNSFEIWWNSLFVHMPAVVLPRLYFLPVPFAFRLWNCWQGSTYTSARFGSQESLAQELYTSHGEKAKRDVKSMKTDKKREKKKEEPEQAPTVIYHFALLGRHHKINEKEEFLCFQELRHQMLRLEMGYGQPALAQENRESSVNSTNPEEIEKRSAFEAFEAFLFCSFWLWNST